MSLTKDRHRPGYYKDYAKRTGRKDRHRKGYYDDYYKRKEIKQKKIDTINRKLKELEDDFR